MSATEKIAASAESVNAGGEIHQEDGPPGSGGWKAHAENMERERDHWRQRAQTMFEHQRGGAWYWQGDGNDHPESMVNSLPVVIRADQLRALIAGEVRALSAAPVGWESVIDEARSGLQDSEPSAFDNSGYRAFAETVLDAVEEGLSALAASPTPPAEQQAKDSYIKLLAECRDAFPIPGPGGPLEVPWSEAMACPEGVPEYVRLRVAAMQSTLKAAPGEPIKRGQWAWLPIEPTTGMLIAGNHGQPGDFSALKVWQDMIAALDRSADYTRPIDPPFVTIEPAGTPLGMYEHKCQNVTGHRGPSFVCQKAGQAVSQNSYCNNCHEAAPQQEAQEPCPSCKNSDIYACTCPFQTSRNTAPKPSPLSNDVFQKTWRLLDELEKLRGANRDEEDWGTLNKRDNELRAALAAQGGE